MQYAQYYNALPNPEDAYSKLDLMAFKRLYKRASDIVYSQMISGKLHLFLKHKHTSVQENEVMVESEYVSSDNKLGFATKPAAFDHSLVASCWTVENGEILPFEFITSELADKMDRAGTEEAVSTIAKLIVDEGLDREIGIGLADRPTARNLPNDVFFVERIESHDHYQQVVLPYSRSEVAIKDPVPTRWIIHSKPANGDVRASLECEPVIVCIPRSPGHAEENQGHINSDDP